jgi:hypothetical protein
VHFGVYVLWSVCVCFFSFVQHRLMPIHYTWYYKCLLSVVLVFCLSVCLKRIFNFRLLVCTKRILYLLKMCVSFFVTLGKNGTDANYGLSFSNDCRVVCCSTKIFLSCFFRSSWIGTLCHTRWVKLLRKCILIRFFGLLYSLGQYTIKSGHFVLSWTMGFVDNETLCIRGLSKYLKAQFVVNRFISTS